MIRFTADGKDYRLEVTPHALKVMQNVEGVDFLNMTNKIITAPEIMFCGLFIEHHNDVPKKKRMEIFNALKGVCEGEEVELDDNGDPVDTLMAAVSEEYTKAINALKRNQGNVSWRKE